VGKVKTFRRKAREFDVNLGRGVRDKREVTDRTERIVVDRTESRHHDVGASVAYALVQPRLQIESGESLASQVAGKVTGSDEHDSFIFHDQGSLFGRSKLEASFGPLAMRAGPICTVGAAAFARFGEAWNPSDHRQSTAQRHVWARQPGQSETKYHDHR